MVSSALTVLGSDRAFELFDLLVLFFVLVFVVTLVLAIAGQRRARRAARTVNQRLESVVRHLGRDLFGEEAWRVVERTMSANGSRVDSLLSILDRDSFETWAAAALTSGSVLPDEIQLIRSRLIPPAQDRALVDGRPQPVDYVPVLGTPVAMDQFGLQTRGTVASIGDRTLTVWILGDAARYDVSQPATFLLLSRAGAYRFDSTFAVEPDDALVVERPQSVIWMQRRRFGRHYASVPARVTAYLAVGEPRDTTIQELGGGGATVTNPDLAFTLDNVVTLTFAIRGREHTVTGRVVRASEDGRQLHLRFEAMLDQQRYAIADAVALGETA